MFFGESKTTIDAKGRVIIKSDWRKNINSSLIMMRNHPHRITFVLESYFDNVMNKIRELDLPLSEIDEIIGCICANSFDVTPDAQGRITIPKEFKEHAELSRDVILIGQGHKIELWDAGRWGESQSGLSKD